MCFGNDSPPPAAQMIAAPPPPPEFMDFFDEVSGVKTVVVTGPDGKKRRVTSRLPRTPEEERKYQMAEQLIPTLMDNLKALNRYDPESLVDFAPLVHTFANISNERMQALGQIANIGNIQQDVADFRAMQNTLLGEEFNIKNRELNENLAQKGRGGGTYAAEARAALARNEAMARQQGDIQANIYGEDLASRRLDRNTQAFNLQEMGRQGQLQSAQGQYALSKEHEADMERRRQIAIQDNRNMLGVASGIVGQDLERALQSRAVEQSLQTYGAEAADSMNRYNADVNRQKANYAMAMEEYKAQPPTFGEVALNLGAQGGMAYLSGGRSMMGNSPFNGSGTNPVGTMRRIR